MCTANEFAAMDVRSDIFGGTGPNGPASADFPRPHPRAIFR